MNRKWDKVQEGDNLLQVKGVLRLNKDLAALKHLTEGGRPPRKQLRYTIQAVA